MKKIYYLLFIPLLFVSFLSNAQRNVLSGMITDKTTGKPLAGATIYIEDLKIAAISNNEGIYKIDEIPRGTYVVTVRYIGYALETRIVKVNYRVDENFSLSPTRYEQNEVVVTGNSIATELKNTPQPITIIPKSYLDENASTNIIDAISKVPGVSGITDGQSIAKPVIRGLGYNRVVTVNDGIRQEGQQWGDEFGIEVDPYSVDRIEILKGPASLVYGSDAISGVINFLPEETMPEGQVKGDITTAYQTNNGLIGTAGNISGTLKGISFSGRIDNTMAHAYQNKDDGYVLNSQFSNFNTDATIGIHRKWGYSQLHYSYFELRTGIVEGIKDSTGAFMIQDNLNNTGQPPYREATNQELHSYTPFLINQLVKHKKLVWDNSFEIGKGRIVAKLAWQQNSRQENNDINIPNTSNIWYFLNTYNYDFRYVSPTKNNFDFSVGINGMSQNSQNRGTLLLIPEYSLFDLGAFAIANKKIGKLNISGGLRYDTRQFSGHNDYTDSTGNWLPVSDPNAIHKFLAYTSNYNGVSASLGGAYQFNKTTYLKANIAKGFRAPNVAESGSNGIHDGTVIYEIGQPNLKPESSLEFDLTPGITSKNVTAEVSVFYNSISNFIYAKGLNSLVSGGDSINNSNPAFPNAPVFLYDQTNAILTGAELMVDVHPSGLKWLDWYTAFSTVNAALQNVPDSIKYIPFTPPARLRSEITINCKKLNKVMRNAYFKVGVYYSFQQSNVYLQANKYQGVGDSVHATPAYTLLNAGFGTDIMDHKRTVLSLYISLDNLTDVSYTDYMSRFKYYTNVVNGVSQIGVHNMGRNISFKIIVPINFRKQ